MKRISFFGGTGGLGKGVFELLIDDYVVKPVGSALLNLHGCNPDKLNEFFSQNPTDIAVIFSNYNFNSFLHKYHGEPFPLDKQLEINIVGITKLIAAALTYMRKQKYGRIIIASSVTVNVNVMGTAVYAAAKAFHENLVKTIALENAGLGITANCLQLGYMDGGLTNTLSEDFLKQKIEAIPAKRLGRVDEIAHAVKFLIENEYVNGATLKLTGGL